MWLQTLDALGVPVLLLWGENDAGAPVAGAHCFTVRYASARSRSHERQAPHRRKAGVRVGADRCAVKERRRKSGPPSSRFNFCRAMQNSRSAPAPPGGRAGDGGPRSAAAALAAKTDAPHTLPISGPGVSRTRRARSPNAKGRPRTGSDQAQCG
jgi:hypothetical protein